MKKSNTRNFSLESKQEAKSTKIGMIRSQKKYIIKIKKRILICKALDDQLVDDVADDSPHEIAASHTITGIQVC